jgi:hypothetical protein
MCTGPCPCEVDFIEADEDYDSATVAYVYVEIERKTEDGGFTTDRYPKCMGYAHFLGEVIVYDLDGLDIARDDDYEGIYSWDVLEDGSVA